MQPALSVKTCGFDAVSAVTLVIFIVESQPKAVFVNK